MRMSKIYITSDLHFNHKAMVEQKFRSFKTLEEMNTYIINQWNSVVSNEDVVYILGDFAFGSYKLLWQGLLKGNLIFIKGNHDPNSLTNIHSMIIKFKGKMFELIHNPEDCTYTTDYVLHGHIHKTGGDFITDEPGRFYNVNTELHKFKPKLLNEILGELQNR